MKLARQVIGVCSTVAIGCGFASSASAATFTFNNFSNTTTPVPLSINGDSATTTTTDGTVLRVVPAASLKSGTAFTSNAVDTSSTFITTFAFRSTNPQINFSDPDNNPGGDGFTFTVQADRPNIVAANGGGLGYGGIGKSVSVAFDTFKNLETRPGTTDIPDPSSNFLAVHTNGNTYNNPTVPTVNIPTNFDDGNIQYAQISYDGANLQVKLSNSTTFSSAPVLSTALNLTSILGQSTAFVGFTASTGGAFGNYDILNWTFTDSNPGPNVPVPEPDFTVGGLVVVGMLMAGKAKKLVQQR